MLMLLFYFTPSALNTAFCGVKVTAAMFFNIRYRSVVSLLLHSPIFCNREHGFYLFFVLFQQVFPVFPAPGSCENAAAVV